METWSAFSFVRRSIFQAQLLNSTPRNFTFFYLELHVEVYV
jgi:hypothetical protein